MTVRKAVVPAAGLGTRLLPATLAVPKELLPLDRKPAVHHIVEEAAAAGVEAVVLVLARGKEAVAQYFFDNPAFRGRVTSPAARALVEEVARLKARVDIVTVYQDEPLGLGHAVLTAGSVLGSEPFALMLPDDHFLPSPLPEMIRAEAETGLGSIALRRVSPAECSRFGIVRVADRTARPLRLTGMVEKPGAEAAPSDLAIMGRYVLPPEVLGLLRQTPPGVGGEIQVTDALNRLAASTGMLGVEVPGAVLDLGTWEGYVAANVAAAARDPQVRARLSALLSE